MEAEVNRPDKEFGIIVRTNAADASKEEILKELEYLKGLYHKAAVDGRSRTCFSCVYRTNLAFKDPFKFHSECIA